MSTSANPVANFIDFWIGHLGAENLSQLYVAHGGGAYEGIARRIANGTVVPCTVIDFTRDPELTRDVALKHRTDPRVAACITYLLDYGRLTKDDDYRALIRNLGHFDDWDAAHIRLLADVPDFLFDQFFEVSRIDLQAIGERLRQIIEAAHVLTVNTTEASLTIPIAGLSWYSMDGKAGDHILPAGELVTIPQAAEGSIAFEGTILGTIPFGFKYGKIKRGQLLLEFRGGNLVGLSGSHKHLIRDLETIVAAVPGIERIGETAISYNPAVAHLPGAGFQWEEKFPGFHFALGAELSQNLESLSMRHCNHHLDFISAAPEISVDGNSIFANGQFLV